MLRGVHVNHAPGAWDFLRAVRPKLVKVVNPDRATLTSIRALGAQVIIARFTLDNVDLTPTPRIAGERWWRMTESKVRECAGAFDLVEVPVNEAHKIPEALPGYAVATAEYLRLAGALGVKCLVGNFSTGTPEPGDAHLFIPALEAARQWGGEISLHEYGLPGRMDETWHLGRWRRLLAALPSDLRLPVWLTEYGIDGGNEGRPRDRAGWAAYFSNPRQYVEWLERSLQIHTQDYPGVPRFDPLLRGFTLFNVGDYSDRKWASFEADYPEIRTWIAQGPSLPPVSPPPPSPPPPTTTPPPAPPPPVVKPKPEEKPTVFNPNPYGYEIPDWTAAYKKAQELGWTLLSAETYHEPAPDKEQGRSAWSETLCKEGRLIWHPVTGVVAVPFE